MPPAKKNFEPLHIAPARGYIIAVKVFLLSLFALLLLGLLVAAIAGFRLKNMEVRLMVSGFSIFILGFLIWLAIITYRSDKSRHRFTHILVDAAGMHHFVKGEPAVSLLYTSLFANNRGGLYDVLLTDMGYSEGDIELCVFIKDDSGALRMQPIRFELFMVPNGNALRAHLVKGIRHFRPDLKIDPQVLTLFHLMP